MAATMNSTMNSTMNWGSETPLIDTLGWQKAAGAHATKAVWCGDHCAFALGDGTVLFADVTGEKARPQVHNGACLAATGLDGAVLTAGDDGRVISTLPNSATAVFLDRPGRFFDQIAAAEWGGIAVADGRRIVVLLPGEEPKEYRASSAVGGLDFSPKGRKLAISRNNGASVYWVGTDRQAPDDYEWKGAHHLITFSPRGDFLVTTMHENALHVWSTDQRKHGQMGGYPSRIKSISFDPKGNHLATAGADGIIIWPFSAKDGPIGKTAEQIPLQAGDLILAVAWHPKADVIAVGTANGKVVLARRDGALLPCALGLESAVTTLAWADKGKALAFGTDRGTIGVLDFSEFAH